NNIRSVVHVAKWSNKELERAVDSTLSLENSSTGNQNVHLEDVKYQKPLGNNCGVWKLSRHGIVQNLLLDGLNAGRVIDGFPFVYRFTRDGKKGTIVIGCPSLKGA
ncbi:hypothetical protein Tco_0843239, partial [Tanacetum coccineum]